MIRQFWTYIRNRNNEEWIAEQEQKLRDLVDWFLFGEVIDESGADRAAEEEPSLG